MRKAFEVLKKYLVINFVLSIAILLVTVKLLPATAIIDLRLQADTSSLKILKKLIERVRITIIVTLIKIVIWT